MLFDNLFEVVLGLGFLAFLIYLPVRFFILIGQVKSLEERLKELTRRLAAGIAKPVVQEPAPLSSTPLVESASAPTPPPLPVKPSQPVQPVRPTVVLPSAPPFARLRDLGMLPPADLSGEYALGAWWAVRVGGVLAVAAVVFLGIWLNLRSTIPPVVRVLEVALVGGGLFWAGLRLAVRRADLGEVIAASGLAVWQFAAWSTYGLDKMRLFEGPAEAALCQFLVALLVAAVALWRGSRLFAQLAVIFAAVAVYFSIGSGAQPWPTATGAGLVAVLGVLLLVRGPWGSAGILGLIGSQACLLLLYDAMPTKDAHYLALQLAALGSFLALWFGERQVKDDKVLLGRNARSAFQLASFFSPALIILFLAQGGEGDRAAVAMLIAAVAAVAGLLERGRSRLVFEVLLLSAVIFMAAGLAWLADPHLVWLIWVLAAAATLLVGARTRSELVRWCSEALAGVAAFAFIDHPPGKPWISLLGVLGFGVMLVLREDWERPSGFQQLRRILGIASLAAVVLTLQQGLSKADAGWPWLVVLLIAAVRFRPALVWAAAPGFALTAFAVVFHLGEGWPIFWSALITGINAFALWRLAGREGASVKVLNYLLSFVTAVVIFALAEHLALRLFPRPASSESPAVWMTTFAWFTAGLSVLGLTAALRRAGVPPSDLSLFAAGSLVGSLIQAVVTKGHAGAHLGLAQAPFVLLGLACLLRVLVLHTESQAVWGTVQRSVLGTIFLFGMVFAQLAYLPGAGVSLFWALAAMLTFVTGHLLATRSLRMIGLAGLGVATLRVLTHDITDMLGRIAACAAVAIAFFSIAWLYGRITAGRRDA